MATAHSSGPRNCLGESRGFVDSTRRIRGWLPEAVQQLVEASELVRERRLRRIEHGVWD
jgi:hypothetical protein